MSRLVDPPADPRVGLPRRCAPGATRARRRRPAPAPRRARACDSASVMSTTLVRSRRSPPRARSRPRRASARAKRSLSPARSSTAWGGQVGARPDPVARGADREHVGIGLRVHDVARPPLDRRPEIVDVTGGIGARTTTRSSALDRCSFTGTRRHRRSGSRGRSGAGRRSRWRRRSRRRRARGRWSRLSPTG